MNYFKIDYSLDVKVIGNTFPQSQKFHTDISIKDPLFIWNNEIPLPKNIYLPDFFLHHKAKLTDFISHTNKYPLISRKLYDCMMGFGHTAMEFRKTSLLNRGVRTEVFLISGKTKGFEFLDLSQTEIMLFDGSSYSKVLDIKNENLLEDMIKELNYPNRISIGKYRLKNLENIDIFYIANIPGGGAYFLSDRLKQAVIAQGCTGIEFESI
ncbi:hypothetical protein [Pedobacter sandarakinus]|uniref:hypothetical protein n=1 Tax=Pedobacter sandarakinus TaxID=353156 RepID=UPI00224716CB|nr:hypothetical protein [Pedobacter sandarakinus]MCX2573591.1 hypothetical protein [Pedobacter sandarakinus]